MNVTISFQPVDLATIPRDHSAYYGDLYSPPLMLANVDSGNIHEHAYRYHFEDRGFVPANLWFGPNVDDYEALEELPDTEFVVWALWPALASVRVGDELL